MTDLAIDALRASLTEMIDCYGSDDGGGPIPIIERAKAALTLDQRGMVLSEGVAGAIIANLLNIMSTDWDERGEDGYLTEAETIEMMKFVETLAAQYGLNPASFMYYVEMRGAIDDL
jgi:hypothetical protein